MPNAGRDLTGVIGSRLRTGRRAGCGRGPAASQRWFVSAGLVCLGVLPLLSVTAGGCKWAAAKTPPAERMMSQRVLSLSVKEPLGIARRQWPVSAGVPFPRGMLPDGASLRLRAPGGPAAVQTRVLSRWPDGSARWVLLDWRTDLAAREERRFSVERGTAAAAHPLRVADHADRIDVDTGPLRFSVPKQRFAVLDDVRLNGRPVTGGPLASFFTVDGKRVPAEAPRSVTVAESGPLRVRIELRGRYGAAFRYDVRIDAFAGQPFVRVFHSFAQHSPAAYTLVQQLAIEVPLKLAHPATYSAGGESRDPLAGALPAQGLTLFQEDNDVFHAGGTARAGHAAGWVDLHDATHGVALAARFFWQEYPQSFALQSSGLTYNLWAPQAPPAKVGMGAAKTHEMVLYFHGRTAPPPTLLAALAQPLLARADPRWIVASGALRNSIAPEPATAPFLRALAEGYKRYRLDADVERWDDSGQVTCPDPAHEHPRRGFYGMFNWGDWNFPGYHDTTKGCDAWGNLEYDMTQVLALAYAATGEPAYYAGMVAAARHFMDVDRIHYQSRRPSWVGMNHPKNPLHFAFELGGVDLGHTWTEGLLSYYYLTGDARALDAARGIADFLVRRLQAGVLHGNPRQWGWPAIALVAAYEATGDAAYRDAALAYARHGMAAHPPEQIAAWKMGILAEGLAYVHSVTGDDAIRRWLTRYAAAVAARGSKQDVRFLPAVAYVGRLTGNAAYLRAAAAAVARVRFGGWGKPFTIAGRLGFSMLSQTTAAVHRP